MNIKQRRCLSETTRSSSPSSTVLPHCLCHLTQLVTILPLFKCQCNIVVVWRASLTQLNARIFHCSSICFDMLAFYVKLFNLMNGPCFCSYFLSHLMSSERIITFSIHDHQNNAPCNMFKLRESQLRRGQRYFTGSNIWLLMTNTISPQFKFKIDPWEQLFLREENMPLGLCSTHLLI